MSREDTIKTSIIGEAALMIARIYKQHIHPLKYDRTFHIDTVRVRVVIQEHKSKDDTLPVFGRRDEDDRISD
jgi:hypothetical protein